MPVHQIGGSYQKRQDIEKMTFFCVKMEYACSKQGCFVLSVVNTAGKEQV